jgi:glycosyltransferase involved in cell wall biosynthesis
MSSSAVIAAARLPPPDVGACELSVVLPCLNEADTLARCIGKAQAAMAAGRISGEIIVADNGSSDGSREIAIACGARLVEVAPRGYGEALRAGIAAARGTFIIMGDADDSYDFGEIPALVAPLRNGADLAQGCRLPRGGGRILPGAMPLLHRWIGNPLFSILARWWFRAPVHDIYCGMRGFRRDYYERLHQRCGGMEFATEMIIRASLDRDARIAEVPITLHPDGRLAHPPHLKTFRDGWRTLRFFLLYAPKQTFLRPGMLLVLFGLLGYAMAMPGVTIGGLTFDAHTLVFASLALLAGYQAMLFALFAKATAVRAALLPRDPRIERLFESRPLERALLAGGAAMLGGLVLLGAAIAQWWDAGFGDLDYAQTMRWVLPGATLTFLGIQTIFAGFFALLVNFVRD